MLVRETVAFPMVGGVESRADSKHVRPPLLLALENAHHGTPGQVGKAFGSVTLGTDYVETNGVNTRSVAALSTLTLKSLIEDGETLYLNSTDKLLAYNPTVSKWVTKGLLPAVDVSLSEPAHQVTAVTYSSEMADYAVSGSLHGIVGGNASSTVWCAIWDSATGERFFFDASGTMSNPRIVGLASGLYMFYVEGASPHNLKMVAFTSANLPTLAIDAITSTAVTVVSADLLTYAGTQGLARYEVAAIPDGGTSTKTLCAYAATGGTNIKYGYVLSNGSLEAAFNTETAGTAPTNVGLSIEDSTARFALLWTTTTPTVNCRLFASDRTALSAALTVETSSAGLTGVGGAWISTTEIHLIWELATTPISVRSGRATTGGSTGNTHLFHRVGMMGYPWAIGSYIYCPLAYVGDGSSSHSYFVCRLGSSTNFNPSQPTDRERGLVIARFAKGSGAGPLSLNRIAHHYKSGGVVRFPAMMSATSLAYDAGLPSYPVRVVGLDFDATLPPAVRAGRGAFVQSGITWRIDDEGVYEAGFLDDYPSDITTGTSNEVASGLTASATYSYRVYAEWVTAAGEVELSSAVAVNVTLGGSDDTVTLTIPTIPITNKTSRLGLRNLGFAVYRANQGSRIYRRVSSSPTINTGSGANEYTVNDVTVASVTFKDQMPDADLAEQPADYLSGEPPEVDNIAPEAGRILHACNGRAFVSGFAHDPDLIWFSKLRSQDDPLSFSDLNTIVVKGGDGPITALSSISDTLLIFRRHEIYAISGDGPNNIGFGGAFTEAALVTAEVGVETQASVVHGPRGVFFMTARGLYFIGADLSVTHVGSPVDTILNVGTSTDTIEILSAVMLETQREIRFITSGFTLVYNYERGVWSKLTVGGSSAVSWRVAGQANRYPGWVRLSGTSVLREDRTLYQHNGTAYVMAVESPWLRLGDVVSGAHRIFRIVVTGVGHGANTPTVKLYYDYSDSVVDTKTWTSAPTSGLFQLEVRPSRQRCQAFKIRIEDADSGGGLHNSFALSEIAVELASYGRLSERAPSSKRV